MAARSAAVRDMSKPKIVAPCRAKRVAIVVPLPQPMAIEQSVDAGLEEGGYTFTNATDAGDEHDFPYQIVERHCGRLHLSIIVD